jgi:hypothetical protein
MTRIQNTIILFSLENMLETEKRPQVISELKYLINHYNNIT